ncbi:MAG: VWA domain-containing protein [Ilumatobacteraceae bacterium]
MTTEFLAPGRLWLLLVVAALGAAYLAVLRWRRVAQVRFTRADLLAEVAPRRPTWRRHVVAAIQLLGLATAVVAVARPVDITTERTRTEGRIIVAIDVSLSMMAADVEPDRLTSAQEAARGFVDEVDDSVEIGLVSFSGAVNVEVRPTLDRASLLDGVERLELAEATAIGDALVTATELLDDRDDPAGDDPAGGEERPPGVIVLLTDGETTVGRPTLDGARRAAAAGVPVFAISFGTPSGSILDPGGSGQVIPVPVRPEELARVAELTGGDVFEAATGEELAAAYDQVREQLGETLGDEIEIVTEHTWRWSAAALALLALAWSLSLWWLRGMV